MNCRKKRLHKVLTKRFIDKIKPEFRNEVLNELDDVFNVVLYDLKEQKSILSEAKKKIAENKNLIITYSFQIFVNPINPNIDKTMPIMFIMLILHPTIALSLDINI